MKKYRGLEYLVFHHMGSLCGYVKLPDGHPYRKREGGYRIR